MKYDNKENGICYKNKGSVCCGDCFSTADYTPVHSGYNFHMSYQPTEKEIRDMIIYDKAEGDNYDPSFVAVRAMVKGEEPSLYVRGTEVDDTGIRFQTEEEVPEVVDRDKNEIQEEIARLQEVKEHQTEEIEKEKITIIMRKKIEREIIIKKEIERKIGEHFED